MLRPMDILPRSRTVRVLLLALVLLAALLLSGAAYQAVSDARDRRAAPPPGRLVQVGGHVLHLHCQGEGRPTVVLEAGATGFAQTWAWVQPELAKTTRVCSYDRPGMGWSEEAGTGHDGATIADHLRDLLDAAGEPGPYVPVGHSLGGPFVHIFAATYPGDVAALGLVDPSHPDQLDRFPPEMREVQQRFHDHLRWAATLAPTGLLRATNLLGRHARGLPERDYRTARMFAASRRHLRTSHAEFLAWDQTMEQARQTASFGDLPILVVSATALMEGMPEGFLEVNHELHAELASMSSRGRQVQVPGADHLSLLMDRDHALETAAYLRELVESVR